MLVLHKNCGIKDPVLRRRRLYYLIHEALGGTYEELTVLDMEVDDFLKPRIITPLLLNIYWDAQVILDKTEMLQPFLECEEKNCRTQPKEGEGREELLLGTAKAHGKSEVIMSLDPLSDVRYRCRLASEHLTRAEKLLSLGDWAGTVSAAQLWIENFAKAVIALFEVPTWSHDPSNQLHRLVNKLPDDIRDMTRGLAYMAHEVAPGHGRSSYGEPSAGLAPVTSI